MIRLPYLRALGAVAILIGIALVVPPLHADDLKDGRAALAAGQYDQALASFEKAASQGLAEGRAGVGQVWLKRRQLAKAFEAFETAQKMDGNLALSHWGQGEVFRRQEQWDKALPLLRRAVELDKKFPDAQMALGDVLVKLKQIPEAIEVLTQGTRWGPKWRPRFLVALGDAELARDSLRSASVYYTQAREEAPTDPLPRRALGDFYLLKRGIGDLAVPEYEAAVALDSTDVELRYSYAQGLFYAQRYSEALTQYRWVVERDPEFPAGQLGLGNLLYLAGAKDPARYAEARAPLERYTQMMPNDAKGWSLLGRTLFYLKERDAALEALSKSVSMGYESKETYTILGRLHAERKEYDKAAAAFDKGEPTGRDLLILAQVYVFAGQAARAESLYNSIIEKDSTANDAKFSALQLGMITYRARNYPEAVTRFQRRIALDPACGECFYYLGLSYKELKQYPDALGALKQSAMLEDAKSDRHFWVGILYAQMDSIAAAKLELGRALDLDSTGTFAGVANRQLGFYKLLDKDYSEAIRFLDSAVKLNDKDTQAWVWLGQANQNSGNRTRAIECYRRVLQLDPNQNDAMKGIQSLGG